MKIRLAMLALLFVFGMNAHAMDRWAALSMLETGDNDNAVGSSSEVSRYQIQRVLWPGGDPHNPQDALAAAKEIMTPRLEGFERTHNRPATDFEFYVLWNAPRKIENPTGRVAERARRFANLVQRRDPLTTNSPVAVTNAP